MSTKTKERVITLDPAQCNALSQLLNCGAIKDFNYLYDIIKSRSTVLFDKTIEVQLEPADLQALKDQYSASVGKEYNEYVKDTLSNAVSQQLFGTARVW